MVIYGNVLHMKNDAVENIKTENFGEKKIESKNAPDLFLSEEKEITKKQLKILLDDGVISLDEYNELYKENENKEN